MGMINDNCIMIDKNFHDHFSVGNWEKKNSTATANATKARGGGQAYLLFYLF